MKILLIQPPATRYAAVGDANLFEPLALEYIAAGVREDHQVWLHDLRFDRDLEKALRQFSPDIVGVTGYTVHANLIKDILAGVKSFNKQILTVVGGHHATVLPEDFNAEQIDLVVIGEGIFTFREIASRHSRRASFDDLPGIAYKRNGALFKTPPRDVSNLDSLPFPDRSITRDTRARYRIGNHGPMAVIRYSVGCKFRCMYCAQWKITAERYLTREPNEVARELESIEEPYVYFADDEAFLDTDRAFQLADEIERRGIKKRYHLFTRADTIANHPDLIKRWKDIGLTDVIVGFECFTDEELKYLKKGTSAHMNEEAMQVLRRLRITNHATMMILPEYNLENFAKVKRYVRTHKYIYPKFPILTPFPGTALFEQNKDRILSFNYDLYDFKHVLLPTTLPIRTFYQEYKMLHKRAIPLWLHIARLFRFRFKTIIPTILLSRRVWARIGKGYEDDL